jgi:hypothetical protein
MVHEERAKREEAEAHARTLSEFIRTKVGTAAWSHADVLRVVFNSFTMLKRDLMRKLAVSAAEGRPASHVLYGRMVEGTLQEATSRALSAAGKGAHRPDMVKPDMLAELEQVLRDDP